MIERSETGAILLTNQGPGNLYFSFESEGVPIDLPEYYKKLTAKNEGMSVEREWLNDEGNPIDITKLKQNDLVVGKVILSPNGHNYDNVAIEDLLPAGLEIENPNLDTTQALPWIQEKSAWCARTMGFSSSMRLTSTTGCSAPTWRSFSVASWRSASPAE